MLFTFITTGVVLHTTRFMFRCISHMLPCRQSSMPRVHRSMGGISSWSSFIHLVVREQGIRIQQSGGCPFGSCPLAPVGITPIGSAWLPSAAVAFVSRLIDPLIFRSAIANRSSSPCTCIQRAGLYPARLVVDVERTHCAHGVETHGWRYMGRDIWGGHEAPPGRPGGAPSWR